MIFIFQSQTEFKTINLTVHKRGVNGPINPFLDCLYMLAKSEYRIKTRGLQGFHNKCSYINKKPTQFLDHMWCSILHTV